MHLSRSHKTNIFLMFPTSRSVLHPELQTTACSSVGGADLHTCLSYFRAAHSAEAFVMFLQGSSQTLHPLVLQTSEFFKPQTLPFSFPLKTKTHMCVLQVHSHSHIHRATQTTHVPRMYCSYMPLSKRTHTCKFTKMLNVILNIK